MKKIPILFAVCIYAMSAMACTRDKGFQQPPNKNDSIVSAALGDSIFSIIMNAKYITAEIIDNADTIKKETKAAKLSKDRADIIKFLLENPDNVASNDTVFGLFMPNAIFTFIHKKQELRLYFDYGLKKWQINDADDKPLKMFDLKSREFLRLAQAIFPDDEYFNKLIKKMGL